MSLLELNNLIISTKNENPTKTLIKGNTLTVEEEDIVGIIGETGSGKSLTLRALMNLFEPDLNKSVDKYLFENVDYSSLINSHKTDKKLNISLRSRIAFLPQNTESYFSPYRKIKDQILDVCTSAHMREVVIQKTKDMFIQLNLNDIEKILNSYSWQLSGGMRQRVNIAITLLSSPKLILCDEPTSALDNVNKNQVADILLDINNRKHLSFIVVSHDLSFIQKISKRIYVLYKGEFVESGKAKDVLNNPKSLYTKRLIESRNKIINTLQDNDT